MRGGFAYLWLPGQYLANPSADVVLSFALGRRDPSPRFKEINDVDDVDDAVMGWLREAAGRSG